MTPNVINIKVTAKDFASSTLKKINTSIQGIGSSALSAAADFGRFVLKVTAGLGALGATVLGFSLKSAMDLEQVSVAFTTMIGNADDAKKLLADLADFAKTTPFELSGIQQNARLLLAYGFSADEVIDKLRMIGDVSAGVGANVNDVATIFGRAKNAGQIFTMEFDQLTDRGIPLIEELAKILGVAETEVRGLASEGIKFEDLNQAFINMTSNGGSFFNMMEEQSKTASGIMSNLKDNISLMALELVGIKTDGTIVEGGIFDRFKNILQQVLTFVENNKEAIIDFAVNGIQVASDILNGLYELVIKGNDDLDELSAYFHNLVPDSVLTAMLQLRNEIMETLAQLNITNEDMKLFAITVGVLTGATVVLAIALGLLTSPIILVGAAILGLAAGVVLVKKAWEENFLGIREALEPFVQDVGMAINNITQFLIEHKGTWQAVLDVIIFVASTAWESIKLYFNFIIGQIESSINIFGELIAFIKNVFTGNWSGAWENIKNIFNEAIDLIISPVELLISQLDLLLGKIDQVAGTNILGGINDQINSFTETLGLATGGSFTVGGNPGQDQNVMSINGQPVARVSQGEQVNVSPQGVGNRGGGGSGMIFNNYFSSDINVESVAQRLSFQINAL